MSGWLRSARPILNSAILITVFALSAHYVWLNRGKVSQAWRFYKAIPAVSSVLRLSVQLDGRIVYEKTFAEPGFVDTHGNAGYIAYFHLPLSVPQKTTVFMLSGRPLAVSRVLKVLGAQALEVGPRRWVFFIAARDYDTLDRLLIAARQTAGIGDLLASAAPIHYNMAQRNANK